MITKITNQSDLENYISENSDYDPEVTYLSQNADGECFAIYGCAHATEAFRFVSDEYALIITDDDYSSEITEQGESDHPELAGFYLKSK